MVPDAAVGVELMEVDGASVDATSVRDLLCSLRRARILSMMRAIVKQPSGISLEESVVVERWGSSRAERGKERGEGSPIIYLL